MRRKLRRKNKIMLSSILFLILIFTSSCKKNIESVKETEPIYKENLEERYAAVVNLPDYSEDGVYTSDEFILLFFSGVDKGAYERNNGRPLANEDEKIVEKYLTEDFNISEDFLKLSKYYDGNNKVYNLPDLEDYNEFNIRLDFVESNITGNKIICDYIFTQLNQEETKFHIVYEYEILNKKIISTKTLSIKEEIN